MVTLPVNKARESVTGPGGVPWESYCAVQLWGPYMAIVLLQQAARCLAVAVKEWAVRAQVVCAVEAIVSWLWLSAGQHACSQMCTKCFCVG